MISIRVNEIFNYLSTDRKKDKGRTYGQIVGSDRKETSTPIITDGDEIQPECDVRNNISDLTADDVLRALQNDCRIQFGDDTSNNNTCQAEALSSEHSQTDISETSDKSPTEDETTVISFDPGRQNQPNIKNINLSDFNNKLAENVPVNVSTEASVEQPSDIISQPSNCHISSPQEDATESTRPKTRKKRNRRNHDRSANSAPADIRSTSSLPVGEEVSKAGHRVSEAKSFHVADKPAVKNRVIKEVCAEDSGNKCEQPVFERCRKSCGHQQFSIKVPQNAATSQPPLCPTSKVQTLSGIDDLDTFDQDLPAISLTLSVCSSSILDTHKIDALDSFDEILPSSTLCHAEFKTDDDEWTAVNRRCKKIVISVDAIDMVCGSHGDKLNAISKATGAHVEMETQCERVTIIIRGTADQIQSANSLVTTLVNRAEERSVKKKKSKSRGGVKSKNLGIANSNRQVSEQQIKLDTGNMSSSGSVGNGGLPSKSLNVSTDDSKTVVIPCNMQPPPSHSEPRQVLQPTISNSIPPCVKEYSLFDNQFSASVEQILRRDSSLVAGQRRTLPIGSARPTQSSAVDHALLAKAPGYRAGTSSPSGMGVLFENPRKYSIGSSSSQSSGRSEDGWWNNAASQRSYQEQCQVPNDRPHSLPQQSYDRYSPPAVLHGYGSFSSDDRQFRQQDLNNVLKDIRQQQLMQQDDRYCNQYEPMTLPQIATDLNPNAPDFVCRSFSSLQHAKPLFTAPQHLLDSYLSPHCPAYSTGPSNGFSSETGWSSGNGDIYGEQQLSSGFSSNYGAPTPMNFRSRWAMPSSVYQESVMYG